MPVLQFICIPCSQDTWKKLIRSLSQMNWLRLLSQPAKHLIWLLSLAFCYENHPSCNILVWPCMLCKLVLLPIDQSSLLEHKRGYYTTAEVYAVHFYSLTINVIFIWKVLYVLSTISFNETVFWMLISPLAFLDGLCGIKLRHELVRNECAFLQTWSLSLLGRVASSHTVKGKKTVLNVLPLG